jgi:hypothetical protein
MNSRHTSDPKWRRTQSTRGEWIAVVTLNERYPWRMTNIKMHAQESSARGRSSRAQVQAFQVGSREGNHLCESSAGVGTGIGGWPAFNWERQAATDRFHGRWIWDAKFGIPAEQPTSLKAGLRLTDGVQRIYCKDRLRC